MKKTTLTLKFSRESYEELPVGTTCVYQNETFTLLSPPTIKKNGERDIEYTLIMGNHEENLSRYKFRNNEDGRLKWSMTAKPAEFIRQIVLNLNARDGADVWSVGTCIDAHEKTIEFNHSYLLDALQSVADAFETEWEIVGHTISLHKVEYFKDEPVALSYGKGNGFVSGVGRASSNKPPVEILYVQGGDKNIDASKYGSRSLLLPALQELEYEGRRYKVSQDGLSIQRADKSPIYNNEDSLDLTYIYPSRVGSVSSVEVVNADNNFYDVIDASIPAALDYNDYVIAGDGEMTIIFQSGMLAGREFGVKYQHSDRRFKIVPADYDGITMPSETFTPAEGDTYAIFGVMLPDEYICDNDSQTGASWEMFKEACRYLHDNEEQKFTFSGTLQGMWAKERWLNVGGKLIVGGYVHFSDNQFAPDGVDIRITGIKDFLFSPYTPTIELSNEPAAGGSSVSAAINKIAQQEVVIEETQRQMTQFTKRRFRDVKETIEMLEGAVEGYSDAISPISVEAMSMLIGDESLQFVLRDVTTRTYGSRDRGCVVIENGLATLKAAVSSRVYAYMYSVQGGEVCNILYRSADVSMSGYSIIFSDNTGRVLGTYRPYSDEPTGATLWVSVVAPAGSVVLYVTSSISPTLRLPVSNAWSVAYDKDFKTITCPPAILTHMTINSDKVITSGGVDVNTCPSWYVASLTSPTLDNPDARYYIYARCRVELGSAEFLLSETKIGIRDYDGFYTFLVGIVNSEYAGERSIALLYGFTEILPSRVTTDRIVSADGNNFFDLANNAMRLASGDACLDWNNEAAGVLRITNATIKNALNVDGDATLAGFILSNSTIKSQSTSQNNVRSIILDGLQGKIELHSPYSGGMNSIYSGVNNSSISMDAMVGDISVRNDDGTTSVSAAGVFTNNARTRCSAPSLGRRQFASIVGVGNNAGVASDIVNNEERSFVAGVYGEATNVNGSAPAYGGFFRCLKANGLTLNHAYVFDSSATTAVSLSDEITQCVSFTNTDKIGKVILPPDVEDGKVIWVKQLGMGAIRVQVTDNTYLIQDHNNKYLGGVLQIKSGYEVKFTRVTYVVNGTTTIKGWTFSLTLMM